MKKKIRFPRRLKKALKKMFSFDSKAITFCYKRHFYFVAMLSDGRLFVDKPFYDTPVKVSLQELSFACLLEDKLNKLQNFGFYE